MHINELRESKFLKKEDCNPPILVTMKNLTQEDMAMEGRPPELKYCLHFMEAVKPLTLNSTNAQLIAQIVGSEETDDWAGRKIVLYADPSISFQGKLVGGIRVRAPRNQPVKATPAATQTFVAPINQPRGAEIRPSQVPCDESGAVGDDVPF